VPNNDYGQSANMILMSQKYILKTPRYEALSTLFENTVTNFGTTPDSFCIRALDLLRVMRCLYYGSIYDFFPKNIIGIGSGSAFIEKALSCISEVSVKCYDMKGGNSDNFMPVEQAEFPKDIEKCLPDDCSKHISFAGFPQGYLGPILTEYIKRGGEMLCTTA